MRVCCIIIDTQFFMFYNMIKYYVKPEIAELNADYLFALAVSPADADSSLEGFDGEFTDLTW